MANSAPIKSQNATAVIEITSEGLDAMFAGCDTTVPVPSLKIPISPIKTMEPTRRNATRSWTFANISTPIRFVAITTIIITTVYTILGIGSGITSDMA